MPGFSSGEKTEDDNYGNLKTEQAGINKGNAMNYLAFIARIVHACTENSDLKQRDAIGGKEGEPALILVQRNQLETHIVCATESHLDLACGVLRDTQGKLKENTVQFDRLKKRVNILDKKLEEKVNDIERQHQNNVDSLRQQHQRKVNILQEQLEKKVKTCEKQNQRRVDILQKELEQKFKTCQTDLKQKINMKLAIVLFFLVLGLDFARFRMTKFEDSNKLLILDGNTEESRIFLWKITSFEHQVKHNWDRYMESVPFYVYGYKLMLRLYLNRFDNGENTHLSIAIFVMKGEYDAILPWGFSKLVKFTLIDQQDNPNQRQNVVVEFTADPNHNAFNKPVEGEKRPGFGFPQFVSYSYLRTRRFIVDDTLFIKVQVDSPKAKTSWF